MKTKIRALYEQEDYLDAYSRHTDLRVDENPHDAIGGHWNDMGLLQFRFLVDNGLKPQHRMLDIGCGTLRGGRHFIPYLDTSRYTGTDISKKVLAFGEELLIEEKLTDKQALSQKFPEPQIVVGSGRIESTTCSSRNKLCDRAARRHGARDRSGLQRDA